MHMETMLLHNAWVNKNAGPNHLRAWREFRQMSQEELAAKVETSASVISMLELGERGLSAKWLRRPAPALNTTPGYLLDHNPEDLPTDIIDIWSHIAEPDRDTARRMLEVLKTGTSD